MRRLGVLGTFVWDRIWTLEDAARGEPFQSWGGIAYSLAAAAAARPPGWEVVPVVKVGRDLEAEARELLGALPGLAAGASPVVVPEETNRVELRYTDSAHRGERLTGGVPGWSWAELEPHVSGLDALYVNFISGFEMGLADAEALRRAFGGPLYADLHSLFLGCPGAGTRELRALPRWERWAACFDTVQLNERELGSLGGAGEWPERAARVLGAGPRLVLVTLGAGGAAYARRGVAGAPPELGTVPPPRPAQGDPTGAGDVWGAAAFAALLAGMEPEDAIRRAHALAARKMEHRGATGLYAHLAG